MFNIITRAQSLALFCLASKLHAQTTYGNNGLSVDRDNDLISQNYQDVDIQLLSPAFLNPETVPTGFSNGTSGPTSDFQMDHFLRSIADRNEWFTYHGSSLKSEQGRNIPYVFLTSTPGTTTTDTTKLRVYIQGGIHGNEPAGEQGILALLGKMDFNTTWTSQLLSKMDILILPRYNPDGVSYFQRELGSNIDPNREGTKLAKQQSRDIRALVSEFEPHVVVDMHEYTGSSVFSGRYRHGEDALIAGAKNLNIHTDIRNLTESLFSEGVSQELVARGFRVEPYVTGSTSRKEGSPIVFEEASAAPTTGRNAYGLSQAVVLLFELRGIKLADQHFQRRTASALVMLEAILNIAAENAGEVFETIESAVDKFINNDDEIVLTDSQPSQNRTFTMVDINNGSLVQVPVEFLSATPAIANLTRPKPLSYLIPRDWAIVADRLRVMGVKLEELKYEYRGNVQAYNITSSRLNEEYYEGTVQNTVTTEPYEKDLWLPAGSWRVSTKQKNAALAFVTLEPESEVSYVAFGIIPVSAGWEYPIFREVS